MKESGISTQRRSICWSWTYHSPENSSAEHFGKWFDYAIAQNPETTFLVTIAWAGHLYKADKKRLDHLKTVKQRFYSNLDCGIEREISREQDLVLPLWFRNL